MKNFNKFYNKIDEIANTKKAVSKASSSKGLLSKSKSEPEEKKTDQDIFNRVAEYIKAIRKQKEEILNGKS